MPLILIRGFIKLLSGFGVGDTHIHSSPWKLPGSTDGAVLDFETNASLNIRVRVQMNGIQQDGTFIVTVLDNESMPNQSPVSFLIRTIQFRKMLLSLLI